MSPLPALDPHRLLSWVAPAGVGLRAALRWGSEHSGLPVVVVAAVVIVLSWRLAKRAARLAVEVTLATVLLLMATRLGWIAW